MDSEVLGHLAHSCFERNSRSLVAGVDKYAIFKNTAQEPKRRVVEHHKVDFNSSAVVNQPLQPQNIVNRPGLRKNHAKINIASSTSLAAGNRTEHVRSHNAGSGKRRLEAIAEQSHYAVCVMTHVLIVSGRSSVKVNLVAGQ